MKKIIKIDGMSCGHCSATVNNALSAIPGVTKVDVDLDAKSATVTMSEDVSNTVLTETVVDAGYQVMGIQ